MISKARIAELETLLSEARDERDEALKLANDASAQAYEDQTKRSDEIGAHATTYVDLSKSLERAISRASLAEADARMTTEALRNLEREHRARIRELTSERDNARKEAKRLATIIEMECDVEASALRSDKRALKVERDAFALIIARTLVAS